MCVCVCVCETYNYSGNLVGPKLLASRKNVAQLAPCLRRRRPNKSRCCWNFYLPLLVGRDEVRGGFEPEWHCCQICQRWKSATPPVVLLARTSFAVVANFFRQPFGPEPSLLFGAVKKRAQILWAHRLTNEFTTVQRPNVWRSNSNSWPRKQRKSWPCSRMTYVAHGGGYTGTERENVLTDNR